MSKTLKKLVYSHETSAMDLLQIEKRVIKLIFEKATGLSGSFDGSVKIGG